MITFDRIVDEIFVGTCPGSALDADRLGKGGITAVLNLQTDADMATRQIIWPELEQTYLALGISAYRFPIVDFDDDDMSRRLRGAADTLSRILDTHKRVYVHCTAGQQRAPSTVIGYLAWHRGYDLEEAISTVMESRHCAPPLDVIRAVGSEN